MPSHMKMPSTPKRHSAELNPYKGKSRVELLAWVNSLLSTQYSKIEQLGTGVPFCQIFDSIWGDVHMHKVKFDAKLEYEYIANFKVLQVAFDAHNVAKIIPVEQLVKCKLQDNLQFLQWAHSYHEQHNHGGTYDPVARQQVQPSPASKSTPPRVRRTSYSSNTTSTVFQLQNQIQDLYLDSQHQSIQNRELVQNIQTLEHERDFYFHKLRDIEILIQQEASLGHSSELMDLIQQIMYTTEDGFVLPNAILDESGPGYEVDVPEPTTLLDDDGSPQLDHDQLETF